MNTTTTAPGIDAGKRSTKAQLADQMKGAPRPGTLNAAIVAVLKRSKEPLGAKEITKRIQRGKDAGVLGGKTPEQTVAARLAVGAKAGHLYVKVERGSYTTL